VEAEVLRQLSRLQFTPEERRYLQTEVERIRGNTAKYQQDILCSLNLRIAQIEDRVNRLTDAYIDRLIEQDVFEARKKTLLSERLDLENQIDSEQGMGRDVVKELAQFLERADSACLAYKMGSTEEKRDLLDSVTSNCTVDGKVPIITLKLPFSTVAERSNCRDGRPRRDRHRIWRRLIPELIRLMKCKTEPQEKIAA